MTPELQRDFSLDTARTSETYRALPSVVGSAFRKDLAQLKSGNAVDAVELQNHLHDTCVIALDIGMRSEQLLIALTGVWHELPSPNGAPQTERDARVRRDLVYAVLDEFYGLVREKL